MTISSEIKFPRHQNILMPGVCPRDLSQHTLIDKNHNEHHIFFNTEGFHNHLIHQYLAAYAFGASKERLQAIFDGNSSIQRPLPDSIRVLTRDTYRDEIGNRNAYTSYLNFFKEEVSNFGLLETVRYWMFKDDMPARVFGGLFHPLIHIAYGIEFNLPSIVAEGLAMGACTENCLVDLMDISEVKLNARQNGSKTVLDILNQVRTDPEFDDVVKFTDVKKVAAVMANKKAMAKINDYAKQWQYKDREASLEEYFPTCMIIYAASGIRKQGIKLDFILMHILTSAHALHTIIPNLNPVQAELLLRGHVSQAIVHFVASGRPALHADLVTQYKSPAAVPYENPWFEIMNRSLRMEECHVIKVVRALALGQTRYGHLYGDMWLKAAEMTLDIAGEPSTYTKIMFDFSGPGFTETWKQ